MVMTGGLAVASGDVNLQIIRPRAWMTPDLERRLRLYRPQTDLGMVVLDILRAGLTAEAAADLLDTITRSAVFQATLNLVKIHGPNSDTPGRRDDYGIVSRKVITDAGVAQLANAFKNTFEPELFNFHGIGTGSTAESAAQTALVTELTTQYNPDSTRATGTQSTPSANVYRTVGTNTVDSGVTIAEHAILSQAATGGGTMWDRSQFTGVPLSSGDSLQSTYDGTFASGG